MQWLSGKTTILRGKYSKKESLGKTLNISTYDISMFHIWCKMRRFRWGSCRKSVKELNQWYSILIRIIILTIWCQIGLSCQVIKWLQTSHVPIPDLLALNNTSFLPLAADSFGGCGPSFSAFLQGSAFPNIRPHDTRDSYGNSISLLSDNDYKELGWIKNDKGIYRPPFFPELLLNQLGSANKHVKIKIRQQR